MAITRTVTVPAAASDHVAALRAEALYTTDRIVAAGGAPLVLWAAWSLWPENRAIAVAGAVSAALLALPVLLPVRSLTMRRIMPVAGLASISVLAWVLNGAFTMTGLLMWSTSVVAAIALGRRAAIGVVVGSCLLLLSEPVARSEWLLVLPTHAGAPMVLTRAVLAFGVLSVTILSVASGVITPLERNLAAATDLVKALRREQRARAALDLRLAQSDHDARVGMARQLQRHLHARLTSLELSLTKAGDGHDARIVAVDHAVATVGELIEYVRSAARQLRPVLLDEAGLAPALEALARSELGRNAIAYEIDLQIDRRLPPAVEVACYRIVQEAVGNIVQHAQATSARLFARSTAHGIEFAVEDDGIGFDPKRLMPRDARDAFGVGLLGMRRRSDSLGGILRIEAAADRGTRVHFTLPLAIST